MEVTSIFIYCIFLIMGAVIGSFCTLAVYRIPIGKDIIHERSFCPNCNHRLEFIDLIPIVSYIFLKGKCRYCGKKIRIRYFIMEFFSGLIFLLLALSLNFSFETVEIEKYIYGFLSILYIVSLIIIGGISRENGTISRPVLLFGIITATIYMIYLFTIEITSINRYVIYFLIMSVLILYDTLALKYKQRTTQAIQSLILITFFLMFTNAKTVIATIIITLILIAIASIKNRKNKEKTLPILFYLCISNIALLIVQNFITYY